MASTSEGLCGVEGVSAQHPESDAEHGPDDDGDAEERSEPVPRARAGHRRPDRIRRLDRVQLHHVRDHRGECPDPAGFGGRSVTRGILREAA